MRQKVNDHSCLQKNRKNRPFMFPTTLNWSTPTTLFLWRGNNIQGWTRNFFSHHVWHEFYFLIVSDLWFCSIQFFLSYFRIIKLIRQLFVGKPISQGGVLHTAYFLSKNQYFNPQLSYWRMSSSWFLNLQALLPVWFLVSNQMVSH